MNIPKLSADDLSILISGLNDPESFRQAQCVYSAKFRFNDIMLAESLYPMISNTFNLAGRLIIDGFESEEERNICFLKDFGVKYESNIEIAELCNYKGEGEEEFVLLSSVLNLPIFISKNDSFLKQLSNH